jgi:hypothetical protein
MADLFLELPMGPDANAQTELLTPKTPTPKEIPGYQDAITIGTAVGVVKLGIERSY